MIGIEIKNINDARATFATVMQDVLRSKEVICQNGKSQNSSKVSIISTSLINEILSSYKFNPKISYCSETNQHEILLEEINIYSYSNSLAQAEEDLIDLVEEYVEQYMSDAEKYLRFEKYKKHYPYILKIAHCENRDEIRRIIF